MDFMDKVDAFLEHLTANGISFYDEDGETAVVCKDCVAVISKQGNAVGVSFINRLHRVEDYAIGFTQEDVDEFMMLEELTGGEE